MDADWPLARHIDADLRLSATKVSLGDVNLGRGAATVSMRQDRLHVDIAELTVKGAPLNAQVVIDVSGAVPSYMGRGKLDLVDVGPMLAHVFGVEALTGAGSVSADVVGRGLTLGDVIQSTSGRVALRSAEPTKLPIDMKSIRVQAKVQGRSASPIGWGLVGRASSNVEYVDIRLALKDGVADVEQGSIKSGDQWMVAKGQVDLRRQTLNLIAGFRSAKTGEKSTRALDLREVDLVSVTGPWLQPAFRGVEAPPVP
jgi:AsmA protein